MKRRYTTVEVIVGEGEWEKDEVIAKTPRNDTDRIGIRVAGYELAIRQQVKEAGGLWRPRQQLWELPYSQIVELGLEDRIVDERGEDI